MTQLTLFPQRPKWTGLARSPLVALEQRKEFLTHLKEDRKTIESFLPNIKKRKEHVIAQGQSRYETIVWDAVENGEKTPEKSYITAYVAEHLQVTPVERARLTSFLRSAYRNSGGKRWETISDAELFNTARRIYRKLDGVASMKLDTLMARAAKDREQYERLGKVLPLATGIGFAYSVETSEHDPLKAVRVPTPAFVVGYTTDEQFWTAYVPMRTQRLDAISAVQGAVQVRLALQHLEDFAKVLAEHYESRTKGLEIRAAPMDPSKMFAI